MLSKKYRLSGKDISLLHKKGRRLTAEGLALKCRPNGLDFARFAVNVPVKTSKKATERNRLRRIVYDEIGKDYHQPKNGGLDCLIGIYQKDDEKVLRAKIKKVCANI